MDIYKKGMLKIYLLHCRAPRTKFGTNWWFVTFYSVIVYFAISLVIPTIILLFVTYNLIRTLNEIKKKKAKMKGENNQSGSSKTGNGSENLTFSLITVVVVFTICNLFNPIRRAIIGIHGDIVSSCSHFLYPFSSLTATVHIFNASVNFTIFVLLGKSFRNEVKTLLLCNRNRVGPSTQNNNSLRF